MPAGLISPAAVLCGLELSGYAIEPIDEHGRCWPACAHSTQNLPPPHTPPRTSGGLGAPIAS
jgi:hypothetical protein